MVINFVPSFCFLEYVFLVILNFQVLNDLMNVSSLQQVYLIILPLTCIALNPNFEDAKQLGISQAWLRGLVNSRLPRTNPASSQGSTWLTRSLWITSPVL